MADDLASLGSEFMSEFGLTPEVFRPRVASLYEAAAHEFQSGASRMAPRDRVTAFLQAKLNSRRSQKDVDSLPGPIGQTARNVLAAAGDLTTGEEFARLGLAISEGSMEPMTSPSYRVQAGDIEGVDEVGQQTLGGKFARAGERFAALAYPDLIEDNRPLSPAFSPVGIAERVAQAAPAALQIAAVGGPVGGAARAVLGRAGLAAIGEGTTMAARGARLATSGAQGAATMETVGAMGRAGREDQRVLDPGAITEDAIVGAIFGLVGQLADEHVASRLKRTPEYQAAAKSVGEEMATAIGRSQVEEIKRRTAEAAINAMRQKSIPMSMLRRLAMAAPGTVAEFSAGVAADMASGLPFDEAVVQGLAFAGADLVDFRRRANFNVDAPTIARDTMGNIERAVADRQARAADAAKTERQQIQQRVEAARAEDSATGASAPSDAPTIGQPPRGVTEVVGASVADTPRPEATFNEEGMQEGRQEGGREGLLSPPDSAAIPPVREEAVAATPPPLPDQPTTGANDERATGPQPVAGGNDPDAGAPGGDRPGALPPSGDAAEAAPVADAGGAVREVVEGQAGGRGEALPPPLLTPDEIAALNGKTLAAALEERDLPKGGNAAQKRARLERYAEGQANAEPTVVDDVTQGVRVMPGAPMRTRSGRLTAAVPEDRSTKATGTLMDAWLHAEAAKEASGSDYLSTLVKGMNPNRLSPSDREMLSSILFGRDVDTSERDPMMRRLRPLAEQQTSPAAETTPQGGDPAATPTVGEEATPTPAGDARPASEAQAAGANAPRRGRETKADRPAAIGKDEPYRYEVVDLNEAIPSHLWSGDQIVKNPDFPEAIQGRDLTTKAARLDIEQKVKNFAPSKMVADGEQGEVGSPIIGDGDNYLDAGRQRWLVLDRVRDKKPDQYRAYVDELKARTDQHGISSEEIDRMVAAGEHPMLVRRRLFALDPTARRQYAQDLDTPRVGERNISDQAAADADVLEPEVFSLLKMGRVKTFESALGQKANLDFVSEFIRRVPRTMRARFTDGEGNLSADGVARIKAALMYKALQGESGRRLIDMATRFDNTGGNIIRGIEIATPRLAMLEAKMADGEVDLGFRISDSLSQAIEIAMAPDQLARLDGGDDMFADGGRLVPYDVEFMAKFLADNRKFPTKIGELLSVYADHAMGGATSRIDAVRAALAAVGDQGELFSAPTSKQIAAAKQKAPKSGAVSNDKLQRDLMSIVPDVPTFTKKGLGRMPSKPGGKLDTNIRGKFDIAKRLIFMARRDDVSTRAHEVGHVVDDGLKITADLPDELRADILSLAGPQIGADAIKKIGNGPIPDTVKAEAFAEWFRALIVNPDEARRLYTIAHEHFLAKLSATEEGRTVLERTTKVSDDIIETLASTPRAQLTAQLSLNLEADRNAFQKIKAKAEADFDLLTNDPVGWKNRYGTALAGLARKIGHRFMYQYVDTAYKFQRSIESVLMGQKRTLGDLRASANPLLLIRAIAGLSGEIQGQFRNGFIDPFQRTKRSDDGKTITENVVEGTSVTKDVFEKLFGKSEEDTRRIVSGWHAMNQAKRLAGLRDSTQRRLDSILIRVDDEEAEVSGWPFLKGGDEAEARYINRLRDAGDAERSTLMAELEAEREAFLDGLVRADLGLEEDGEARGLWRDADAIMEETRAEFSTEELKRMDEASDAYRRIMKVAVLDNLLEAGNMPQSRYDRFIEHQDFYFGFQRDLESLDVDSVAIENKEVSERVRRKYNELAQSGRVIHRLGGSSRSFQDQLVSMGLEIERAMRAAAANRAKRATAALLEYQPTGETRKFQDDYKPESAVAFVSDEPLSRNGMEPVAFRDGGKQRYLVIGDADFASVFRDTRSAPMGLDNVPVMRALAWYAKWQRSTITTTPWFVIRQLIRDPLSTAILSRNGTTARQIWGALIKSWMGKFDAQSKMQQFEAYGGSAFSYERLGKDGYGDIFNRMAAQAHEQSAGAWVVHHPGTALKAGWNWWRRHIVEPSEYLSRIVEMENALKRSQADPNRKEWTDYDHMLWAVGEGRALMDFAVAGEVMRTLNKYAPFTTAAMRGVARAAEAAVDDPRGFAERIIKVSILPAMAYAAYIAMLPDEAQEEYEQMPARLRDLTFPIYVGSWLEDTTGVRWVMVPKPYELGVPGSIVQRFIAHTMGEPNAFDGLGESMMQTIVPVQPKELLFGGTTPIVEWITNRSLWDNRPIVPPWDEGRDVKLRDTSSASVLGQTIDRLSGYRLDARKADWLVRQGVGGWAQAAMGLSDLLRADRGELTWGIGAGRVVQSTGLVRGTTAGYGKDVTASFDLAQRYGLTQAPQVVALRRQLERFHTARTPAERRSRAEAVRARSRETRAWLERQGARADRAGARVKERQRRETFGR